MKDSPGEDSYAGAWQLPPELPGLLSVLLFMSPFVLMVVFPLPPSWIDVLTVLAMGASFLLFVIAFVVRDNLSFAIFPAAALALTLFRLSLYAASLRAVVWKGMAS